MHGYHIINVIKERTNDNWAPSPGAVYPTLSLLEDEGLITISTEDGRKLAALTDEGKKLVDAQREGWESILAAYTDEHEELAEDDPRAAYMEIGKIAHLLKALDRGQLPKAAEILRQAREELKQL